jgi:[acyl-carrier-protein] S-malonyltransferase
MQFLVFPGQGSQQPGMGKFLVQNFTEAGQVFEEASDAIKIDLKKLCFDGTEADLTLTHNTQPALLVTSTATQTVLRKHFGVKPILSAGHSIGEYAALVAAGSLKLADATRAVRIRGQAMQEAVPAGVGAMAAVMGLEPAQVLQLCAYVQATQPTLGSVSAANFNAPGQIVISGHAKVINWLKDEFKPEMLWPENGPKRMRLIPLQVSAPFHCALMEPAQKRMEQVLNDIPFSDAQFSVIQNIHAMPESRAEILRKNLIEQVSGSVLWMQSMTQALSLRESLNWSFSIECGHGKVLQGLLKKIDPQFEVLGTSSMEELKTLETRLSQ